jgi:hypothetical protein
MRNRNQKSNTHFYYSPEERNAISRFSVIRDKATLAYIKTALQRNIVLSKDAAEGKAELWMKRTYPEYAQFLATASNRKVW